MKQDFDFVDNRSETVMQRNLQKITDAHDNDIHMGTIQKQYQAHETLHVLQQKHVGRKSTLLEEDDGIYRDNSTLSTFLIPHSDFLPVAEQEAVMQPKWLEPKQGSNLRWDSMLNGLRWSFNRFSGKMSFIIEAEIQVPKQLRKTIETLESVQKTYQEWLSVGIFSPGNWKESDSEIIPKEQPQPQTMSGMKMSVSATAALQIAERVYTGQPGLDPDFTGKNGGASFFIAEGNPYTGVLEQQNVEVVLTVDVPPGLEVFNDLTLLNIHCDKLIDLAVREFNASRSGLSGIRDDLVAFLLGQKSKHTDFDQSATDLGFTSNGKFKDFLRIGKRASEQHLWNTVGRTVVDSGTGVGLVVMGGGSHVTKSPGKFLVVAPKAIPTCFVSGGDKTFMEIFNNLG